MKRKICFVMSVIMIFIILAPCAYAQDTQDNQSIPVLENAVYFTCTYSADTSRVIIDGTVNHDMMISHKDYTIRIFSILPGASEYGMFDADNVLAQSSMTVRFTFYIDISNILERYSRYVIVFTSPEDDNFIAGEPRLPSVSSDFEYYDEERASYKGFMSDSSFNIANSGAGTVIVNFDLDRAFGDVADSYLYPSGDKYFYINKSYITEIDKSITAASLSGSKIYLRFLLNNGAKHLSYIGGAASKSVIPDVYSADVLDFMSAVTEFTAKRYKSFGLYGFISGAEVDTLYNGISDIMSISEFADLYTLLLAVVGSSARVIDNSFDIVIPISDRAYALSESADKDIVSEILLESIVRRLDKNVSGRFDCSLMLEADYVPNGIFDNSPQKLEDIADNAQRLVTPETMSDYIAYVHSLSNTYDSAPAHIIYKWTPKEDLRGNALCCSYIYMYLKLLDNEFISSFVCDTTDSVHTNYSDLDKLFRDIDIDGAEDKLEQYANWLGRKSWQEIVGEETDIPKLRVELQKSFYREAPEDIIGSFCYTEFASSMFETMTKGQSCQSIISDYNAQGDRVLRVNSDALTSGMYMDAIGFFEYPENYKYTDILSLKLEIEDLGKNDRAIYEVILTLGSGSKRINVTGTMGNGESAVLYFDADEFSDISEASYIRLSVRCLTGDTQGISLLLHDLTGYSTEYTSEELDAIISELRSEIRGENNNDDGGFNKTLVITIVTVAISLIAVAIGLFMVFRRDD